MDITVSVENFLEICEEWNGSGPLLPLRSGPGEHESKNPFSSSRKQTSFPLVEHRYRKIAKYSFSPQISELLEKPVSDSPAHKIDTLPVKSLADEHWDSEFVLAKKLPIEETQWNIENLHRVRKNLHDYEYLTNMVDLVVEKEKTLMIDLDETLLRVGTCDEGLGKKNPSRDVSNQKVKQARETRRQVWLRPHARELLANLSTHYNIIVFTASRKEYALTLVKLLDPDTKHIKGILSREHCLFISGSAIKDMRILSSFDPSKCIMVDNCIASFALQLQNGIYLPSFLGNPEDDYLFILEHFLNKLAFVKDVRRHVIRFSGVMDLYRKYIEKRSIQINL